MGFEPTTSTPTVEVIAKKFGIESEQISLWAANDPDFQAGLESFRTLQDQGTFDDLNNRADVSVIAVLLLQTKQKHKK